MSPSARVAPLLFVSGACALVYQVAWLREFRLVFGASTAASAAVLAIFIGGLGVGGLLIGPLADRRRAPLLLYARLEAAIACFTALTPGLLWLVRRIYVGFGGSVVLGPLGGTLTRLVLATLVLAVPTLLMGGTLPAAARAVETAQDQRRRGVALLYGVNTLGAVAGSFFATFVMLELFGTRRTLWLACAVNFAVSVVARAVARKLPQTAEPDSPATVTQQPAAPARFVLAAAGIVGFAFFLMEMVWYRMLGPLLGGSVFTFGLILTVALFGIALGGAFYATFRQDRPATLFGFATTCLLEALCLALPFGLGDQIAVLAALLRPLGGLGFWGYVVGWTGVAAIVVLPAAFVAGVQFPLLVALLGRGREAVGRQIGLTYAWNTAGAILGSLAGGFGLLPLLTAPGCWRLVSLLLVALGLAALALCWRSERRPLRLALPALIALLAVGPLFAQGPSAVWRHSGIGVGRAATGGINPGNGLRAFLNQERRALLWETDGVESSVALMTRRGMAFVMNGKVDGHPTLDTPTAIMSGLLGAILHQAPRKAMVIGLGTGSTAGWLGVVPELETVDVVELEAGVLEVARACAAVNQDVMRNPRVHISIGDAREVLLTTPRRYDLIFSEPSNPYRAGIASMFTREFYEAIDGRLAPGGVLVQWIQLYEVSGEAIRTVYSTLGSVFPHVESWRTHRDLLLVATREPLRHSAEALRKRVAQEPYRAALANAWRVSDLEGFLAYFVASPDFARAVRDTQRGPLNTDDRNVLEFGFASSVARHDLFRMSELFALARARGEDRPSALSGEADWGRVQEERARLAVTAPAEWPALSREGAARVWAYHHSVTGDPRAALEAWRSQPDEPRGPLELAALAEGLAVRGDEAALRYIESLRQFQPVEADTLLARLRLAQSRHADAAAALEAAFVRHRSDPWPRFELLMRAFVAAKELAGAKPEHAARLVAALGEPFAARAIDEERRYTAFEIASRLGLARECAELVSGFEPWVPWGRDFLQTRAACYEATGHPRAALARAELRQFLAAEPAPFGAGMSAQPVPLTRQRPAGGVSFSSEAGFTPARTLGDGGAAEDAEMTGKTR